MGELKQISKRRRISWYCASWFSWCLAFFCFVDLFLKYIRTNPSITEGKTISIALAFAALVVSYRFFLEYAICTRVPSEPYKLPPSVKRLFDCVFVVVCSCWGYYTRADGRIETSSVMTAGLLVLFHVLPTLNMWWGFINFSVLDCFVAVLFEAAVFFGSRHGVVVIARTFAGIALQGLKNDYQQQAVIDDKKKMN